MTEQRKNSYEDADFRDVLAEAEGHEDAIRSIMSAAMGEAGGLRKKIKALKKKARDELGIPTALLNASLKTRALERKMQEISEDVPEDLIELWTDVSGQFSFLAPAEGEEPAPKDEPVAKKAARRAKKKAEDHQAAEQEEGARVLSELAPALN